MALRARITIPGGAITTIALDRPPYTVGRAPENSIPVLHPTVSSRHGEIIALSDGALAFVDRGSRNGTRLNGMLLQPGVASRLTPGDRLQLGSVLLVIESAEPDDAPRLQLEIRGAAIGSRQLEVTAFPFRLGRSDENDLSLARPTISSRHGEFRQTAAGVVYVDLGSRNGSRINGAPVAPGVETRLQDGDTIQIGDVEVIVRFGPGPARDLPPTLPRGVPHDRPASPPPRRGAGGAIAAATATVAALCVCACLAGGLAALVVTTPRAPLGGRSEPGSIGRDGMPLVRIPAGPFIMGSESGEADEAPVRVVELPAYSIDRTKVTVEMFSRWAAAHRVQGAWSRDADPKSPVVGVTYADAENYCKAQGRRLPTEAEWEKAARGDDGRVYPWGNNWDPTRVDFGSFKFSAYPIATFGKTWGPAGAVPQGASVYGVLDVAGGPREWVADWYAPYPGAAPLGFEVPKERFRVTRGGFRINNYSRDVRTTARGWQHPNEASPDLGFRCAE
ncbi:MAG: SUMF1/EgtB/PvdO family nonheme iron enzyme [Chloroflexota bacterium]|nr:SUMF1/EgtB/PvdO family nonheme iron enzyme [Dehalococcoidia bacterium]MDW8252922.1 SUMF1/EgtB/PvdO family nonheme iron enzyme [Chloroflexota bacterium]